MDVEKPRTMSVPIRVTPFMGSALAKAAAKVGGNARKNANSVRKTAAKPLYRWEKRRYPRSSTVAQPNVASKASSGRKPKLAEELDLDEVDEAGTELHPCSDPGHYSRSSFSKISAAAANTPAYFEFQIILTEDELKALKYQRRRLEAEQRHLSRRQQPGLASSIQPPPVPTAAILERKNSPSNIAP